MVFVKMLPELPKITHSRPAMGYNHCAPPSAPGKSTPVKSLSPAGELTSSDIPFPTHTTGTPAEILS